MQEPLDPIAPFGFLTAGQIRFGRGTAKAHAGDVRRYGNRIMLVRGHSVPWVDQLAQQLQGFGCKVVQVYGQGEPTVTDVEAARALGRETGIDAVMAVGGGAVIDLGKAAAAMIPANSALIDYLEGVGGGQPLDSAPLPFVAIPTTAGTGSEVTRNAVIAVPDAGRKVSLRDDRMLPRLAIVDPGLTDGTPSGVTLASGLDAITQVIEPYLSRRANPLTDALCRSAIPMGLSALARLAKGEDPEARDRIAYVSLIGGLALANAGLGAVHGLAGVIGGRFGAPHGLICGRLLGPVLCANKDAARAAGASLDRYEEIADWMADGFDLPVGTVFPRLSGWLDVHRLPRLGGWLTAGADLEAVATAAAGSSSMNANPRILPTEALVDAIKRSL